jgi:hypothetical protein
MMHAEPSANGNAVRKTVIHIYKTVIKISTSIASLQFGMGAVASKITTKAV